MPHSDSVGTEILGTLDTTKPNASAAVPFMNCGRNMRNAITRNPDAA